jgi:inner membrane protein YidH
MSSQEPAFDRKDTDVTRRTWLAAERTWLAWWRTGIAVAAVAIAIGRFLPGLAGGTQWPYRILGLGYGALGIAILVIGAVRQRSASLGLERGEYAPLSSPVVMWMTAGAIVLALATMLLVAINA